MVFFITMVFFAASYGVFELVKPADPCAKAPTEQHCGKPGQR